MRRNILQSMCLVALAANCGCFDSGDQIRLTEKNNRSRAAILLDGRRDGVCFDDQVVRTAGTVTLTNVQAHDSCPSNIAVLDQDHAFVLQQQVDGWTNSDGDHIDVSMRSAEQLPLAIWLATGPASEMGLLPEDVQMDVTTAKSFFNGMQCGIDFGPVSITEREPLSTNCSQSDQLPKTAGAVNVYYVREITEPGWPRGIACNERVVLIARDAEVETLAHEIGHVLSLQHTNAVAAMPPDNLMAEGSDERHALTTGQCFRANLDPTSAITTGHVWERRSQTHKCPAVEADQTCPALSFDVQPK